MITVATPEERAEQAKQREAENAERIRLVEDLKAALRYLTVATKEFIKASHPDSAGSIAIKDATERFRGAVGDLRTFAGHEDGDELPEVD